MEKIEDGNVWKNILNWILDKLNEPTTYVAFFNFLAVCGVIVKPELADLIKNVCISVDALVLFLINENKIRRRFVTLNYEYESMRKVNDSLSLNVENQKETIRLLQENRDLLQKDNDNLNNELKTLKSSKKK